MWISKKKYNELVAQKDDFERIAANAVAQNSRLLDDWQNAIEEMKDIQRLNHALVKRNEELVVSCRELEKDLAFVTRQRDYYYDLLEDTTMTGEEERNDA